MTKVKNSHLDKFAVAYVKDGVEHWLQTEFSEAEANRARDIVNDHEERNGRPRKFYVLDLAK